MYVRFIFDVAADTAGGGVGGSHLRGLAAENRAAATQLVAIGQLFAHRLSLCSETEDWAIDTEAAVSAEVAAALRISQGLAGSRLRYARAMRERLPRVGEVFAVGDIDYRMFQTIVYRSDLITDPDVLASVDGQLAANVARWPSMTKGRLAAQIDNIVARADADAVRRHTQAQDDREIWIGDRQGGTSEIHGSLFTPDARVLEAARCAGDHGLSTRSTHSPAAPRRRSGRVGRWGRSAGMRTPKTVGAHNLPVQLTRFVAAALR
jgi:hypothetical protein